jgi:hypothetical protein
MNRLLGPLCGVGEEDIVPGADPGFQVRGGGCALRKIAPSVGRRDKFWSISCEKSRFYAKKTYPPPLDPPLSTYAD